jgi:hypothetical protein
LSRRNKIRSGLFFVFLFSAIIVVAQKQKPKNESWYDDKTLHFGFSVGFNTMDFKITPTVPNPAVDSLSLYPEVSKLYPGINIQIVSDFKPARDFDIRFLPGVSFGQRVVMFYNNGKIYNSEQKLESSFLEFPLLLKYKGLRLNNIRPYLIGGLNFRYDLAAKKEFDQEKPVYMRLRRSDLYYEIGPGFDFYLPYFKLSIELKMSNGLRDVLVHDNSSGKPQYVNSIEKMKSQIWIIAFHFE